MTKVTEKGHGTRDKGQGARNGTRDKGRGEESGVMVLAGEPEYC